MCKVIAAPNHQTPSETHSDMPIAIPMATRIHSWARALSGAGAKDLNQSRRCSCIIPAWRRDSCNSGSYAGQKTFTGQDWNKSLAPMARSIAGHDVGALGSNQFGRRCRQSKQEGLALGSSCLREQARPPGSRRTALIRGRFEELGRVGAAEDVA